MHKNEKLNLVLERNVMKYPILKSLYYKNREEYYKECENRPNSISAVCLPAEIHGVQSYYLNCHELTCLVADCYIKAGAIQKRISALPGLADKFYRLNCLIDEVMLSNDLEGVRSTRKEIRKIIDADKRTKDNAARLAGMVKKYLRLLDPKDSVDLTCCASIRALYDELVAAEVDKDERPDGTYFRKGQVSVVTATDKEKHKGVAPPEENIVRHMDLAIKILNDEEIPALIRIALFHYYFGYIHPFYDGNGRMSRFISSYLLMKNLDELTALRLSYSIKERKNKYYEAFDIVNDRKNKGDTTPFILAFLKIIVEAEDSLIEKIDAGMDEYEYYKKTIKILDSVFDHDTMQILFILIQNRLFGGEALDIAELSEAAKISRYKTRQKLEILADTKSGCVVSKIREGHKLVYSVELDQVEMFCAEQKN